MAAAFGKPPTPVHASSGLNIAHPPGLLKGASYQDASPTGHTATAATAASAAYPRSVSTAGLSPSDRASPALEKEYKTKPERPKMKLFSKPKSIAISRDKDLDKRDRPLPSPNKMGIYGPSPLPQMYTASTTSLSDPATLGPTSGLYPAGNGSTATLLPPEEVNQPSEKPKHHFLSRQKLKLRDRDDGRHHPSSSSGFSGSTAAPSNTAQSLYTFPPPSPGYTATSFAKTVSGLDILHGGRALREKKREEKASAAAAAAAARDEDLILAMSDWPGSLYSGLGGLASHPGAPKPGGFSLAGGSGLGLVDGTAQINLPGLGLAGMTYDDAWPYLNTKLLALFEGEPLRLPIEGCNKLVLYVFDARDFRIRCINADRRVKSSAHIQRCVQSRTPHTIIEDLHGLLHAGFSSLNSTRRRNFDERLVPSLAELWLAVFGTILPYLQAAFLPLDHEFKGTGPVLGPREASDFWRALPDGSSEMPLAETLDVRRIVLIVFRDLVILSRYNRLQAVFSRLSLASINGSLHVFGSGSDGHPGDRPGTAASLDPGFASYNSQGSTLLNESGGSLGARSRATSNTSSAFGGAPSPAIEPFPSPPAHFTSAPQVSPPSGSYSDPTDSARVTETVGRMLQCVSVLAALRTGDDAQQKMEELAKSLKHNWLGRGRTGRNRKGFVGTKLTGSGGRL